MISRMAAQIGIGTKEASHLDFKHYYKAKNYGSLSGSHERYTWAWEKAEQVLHLSVSGTNNYLASIFGSVVSTWKWFQ